MNSFAKKAGWIMAALLGLTLAAIWSGVISAGSLDPPGNPASTMKSLDDIPGSWSRVLSTDPADQCNNARFLCVMSNDAVLDRETGLVWERQPNTNTMDWDSAIRSCHIVSIENRFGWRLPTLSELRSLQDASSIGGLPPDHPFIMGANDTFWSSTANTASTGRAMSTDLDGLTVTDDLKSQAHLAWCVRSADGGDVQ